MFEVIDFLKFCKSVSASDLKFRQKYFSLSGECVWRIEHNVDKEKLSEEHDV